MGEVGAPKIFHEATIVWLADTVTGEVVAHKKCHGVSNTVFALHGYG